MTNDAEIQAIEAEEEREIEEQARQDAAASAQLQALGGHLTVRAQLPSGAHRHLPETTPVRVISRHANTPKGRRNAYDSVANTLDWYARTHGNAAARQVWVESDDGRKWPVEWLRD